MSDIGLPNILMTQALPPPSQPNAELSSRRTGSKTLKREDSSNSEPAGFSDLVEDRSSDKSSDASKVTLNAPEKKADKKFAGDDSLRPISLDRSRRRDDEESPSDDPSASDVKSEKPKAPENKKTKALKDFMAQMQQHFGIKPQEILQAFAKLSPQELMQSPQDVTAQVLKNLNLSEDQKPLAGLIYQQMLAQTAEIKTQPLASASVENHADVATGFVPKASVAETEKAGEAAKTDLMSKLQSLKGDKPVADSAAKADAESAAEGALSADMDKAKDELSDLQKLAAELKKLAGDDKSKDSSGDQAKIKAAAAGSPLAANGKTSASALASSSKDASSDVDARVSALAQMMGQASGQAPKAGQADSAQAKIASNTDAAVSLMPTLTALMSKFSGGEKNSSGEQGQGQKDMKAFDALQSSAKADGKVDAGDVFAALTQQGSQAATSHTGAAAAGQPGAPVSAGDLTATINEIISKSQVLVKKGGGEMKIEMKSESMGPLNMKVAVQNGQVSVQMITQNDKAKKALEENMHELKTALATHKLEVGDIKVGLSEGAHKHQDHNAMDQQAREQAREAAGQFLSNMHDEREQNRGGFFDQPGFHSYSQNPARRATVGPAPEVTAAALSKLNQNRSFGRAGNSGRLSMVA